MGTEIYVEPEKLLHQITLLGTITYPPKALFESMIFLLTDVGYVIVSWRVIKPPAKTVSDFFVFLTNP